MKLSMLDRLLLTIFGLLMLGAAVLLALEAFFGIGVTAYIGQVLTFGSVRRVVAFTATVVSLVTLGIYAVLRPWNHRSRKRGFVLQQGENGAIGISMKAIDSLVRRCLEQHEEIQLHAIALADRHDGLVVKLRVSMASGMNIPLAVGALQKQIRQYVTACSGVDVAEVDVQVEASEQAALPESQAAPSLPGALPMEEPQPAAVTTNVEVEMPSVQEKEAKTGEQEEERPLHQRLFGAEEQHVTVPVPPEETIPEEAPAAEEAEETLPAEAEKAEEAPEAVPETEETVSETEEAVTEEKPVQDEADEPEAAQEPGEEDETAPIE